MDSLRPYILPLKGLGDGNHQFDFEIDAEFFSAFEESPVEDAKVSLQVELDKRPSLLVLNFSFSGWVGTTCDRCLVPINLPVQGENQLLVKYGEAGKEPDSEDVVYIPLETSNWSIAQFAYEYVLLALPIIKVFDCQAEEEPPCDQEMLDRLDGPPSDEAEENTINPLWDALKDWDSNDA